MTARYTATKKIGIGALAFGMVAAQANALAKDSNADVDRHNDIGSALAKVLASSASSDLSQVENPAGGAAIDARPAHEWRYRDRVKYLQSEPRLMLDVSSGWLGDLIEATASATEGAGTIIIEIAT